jgi:hypothetical protein
MKWFDNWFAEKVQESWNRARAVPTSSSKDRDTISFTEDRPNHLGSSRHRMNFTVYRANGGTIVEYNKYDERKDQHHCDLHIVHEDENLGEALAKIITFESLKS